LLFQTVTLRSSLFKGGIQRSTCLPIRNVKSVPSGRGYQVEIIKPIFRPFSQISFALLSSGTFFMTAAYFERSNHYSNRKGDYLKEHQNRRFQAKMDLYCLIGVNAAIMLAWRIPGFSAAISKHFVHQHSAGRSITLLTSTFSHADPLHLILNMLGLYSFGLPLHYLLGQELFFAFYLSAGVISTTVSQLYRYLLFNLTRRTSLIASGSLGASGAVLALIPLFAHYFPNANLSLIFLPTIPIPINYAVPAMASLDVTGLVLGWRLIDHAAHLGGMSFGWLFANYGQRYWAKRDYYLNILMNQGSKKGKD